MIEKLLKDLNNNILDIIWIFGSLLEYANLCTLVNWPLNNWQMRTYPITTVPNSLFLAPV